MSPFLLIQNADKSLRYCKVNFGSKPALSLVEIPVANLARVSTIEAAEDYYIESAEVLPTIHDNLTTFALNAQASVQASHNVRGLGRIALMHPLMFEKIRNFPEGGTQFRPEYQELGRWRLVAIEPEYRNLEVWISDHLAPDEIITVYKPHNPNLHDGMAIMRVDDGFALVPAEEYCRLSFIHRRRVI